MNKADEEKIQKVERILLQREKDNIVFFAENTEEKVDWEKINADLESINLRQAFEGCLVGACFIFSKENLEEQFGEDVMVGTVFIGKLELYFSKRECAAYVARNEAEREELVQALYNEKMLELTNIFIPTDITM